MARCMLHAFTGKMLINRGNVLPISSMSGVNGLSPLFPPSECKYKQTAEAFSILGMVTVVRQGDDIVIKCSCQPDRLLTS